MEKFKLCLQLLLALNFLLLNSNYVYGQEHKIINVEKVGEITGSEKIFLGAPTDIEVINGEVFIADLMDLKIKVFSSEGEFLREIGGQRSRPWRISTFYSYVERSGWEYYKCDGLFESKNCNIFNFGRVG